MEVDPDVCRRALAARDPRFDGRFVAAAADSAARRGRAGESARSYCRPSCAAGPRGRDVRFFPCAAAAEAAGLRPCRRCRPEAAPGSPIGGDRADLTARALRLIDDGALDGGDAAPLAAGLGIDERELVGLFERALGASPAAVAASRRAHFAGALLEATDLPMIDVARAAGLGGSRRLDRAVRAAFGRSPAELREGRTARAAERAAADRARRAVGMQLELRPPLAWRALLEFFAARAIPGVEAVDLERGVYRRTFRAGGGGVVTVGAGAGRAVDVAIAGAPGARPAALLDVVRRVRRLFDLDADPAAVAERLGASRLLGRVLAASPGLRVPGAWEPFEVLVRAILGQQISVAAARTLAGRLVERCGEPLSSPAGELGRVFPLPAAVAAADVAAIGLPSARARSLRESAAAVARAPGLLGPAGDRGALIARLRGLPGVGPWTAEYVAMRLGEPDAFPAGDLGLRRAVGDARERDLLAAAEPWRPWRAYAAVALWRSLGLRPAGAAAPSGVGLGKVQEQETAPRGGTPCRPNARASNRR